MTVSERATSHIREMPERDRPISEQYRLAANAWCEMDGTARRLEELKTSALEKKKSALIAKLGDMPDNKAERIVKSSEEWEDYLIAMVEARTEANKLKVTMEVLRMQEREIRDKNETIRAEQRLMR